MGDLDIEALMSEPPGGLGYGRKRSPFGRWQPLGLEEQQSYDSELYVDPEPTPVRRSVKPADTIRHGTLAAYKNDKCRCSECRAANASYVKGSRDNVES